jgi:hypothetical protein
MCGSPILPARVNPAPLFLFLAPSDLGLAFIGSGAIFLVKVVSPNGFEPLLDFGPT